MSHPWRGERCRSAECVPSRKVSTLTSLRTRSSWPRSHDLSPDVKIRSLDRLCISRQSLSVWKHPAGLDLGLRLVFFRNSAHDSFGDHSTQVFANQRRGNRRKWNGVGKDVWSALASRSVPANFRHTPAPVGHHEIPPAVAGKRRFAGTTPIFFDVRLSGSDAGTERR